MNYPGLFGKLPSHGDFIQRNLPASFVRAWDEWLQHFIAGAKEKMGHDWLDIYLTSPIWRFALSHGIIDENRWAGIIMPSVDQVGRYFPLTIASRLASQTNPLEFIAMQSTWFSAVEDLALAALDGDLSLDALVQELGVIDQSQSSAYIPSTNFTDLNDMQVDMEFEEQSVMSVYPHVLDAMLVKNLSSYSAWSTQGSELVAPCFLYVQGLPAVNKLPALLDGQWQHWGWQQPYILSAE